METGYSNRPPDFTPPDGWRASPESHTILAKGYARRLLALAVELDGAPKDDSLRRQAGQIIIDAFNGGFLRAIPNLGQRVAWHTASDDDDPKVGVDVPYRRCRSTLNLLLDLIGGQINIATFNAAGECIGIKPKLNDGILPAIFPKAFKRGDAAEASRFLADIILTEAPVGGGQGAGDGEQTIEQPESEDAYIARADLAKKYGLGTEATRKRLDRWRENNKGGGWIEAADRKANEPQYFYRLSSVRHLFDKE
jgi:hypothetical protein